MLVLADEEIARCQSFGQRQLIETFLEHPVHARRQLHLLLEHHAVRLLALCARVAHRPRMAAHAPLAAPLVAHHRPHRAAESTRNTLYYLCHNQLFKLNILQI